MSALIAGCTNGCHAHPHFPNCCLNIKQATPIPTKFLHTNMQLRSATSSCRGVRPVVVAAAAVQRSRPRAQAASAAVPGTQQQRQQATMTNTPPSTTRTGAVFPDQYQEQLSAKVGQVRELFAANKLPEIEVFRSATANFRMRAEFTIWHEVRSAAGLHMHPCHFSCCQHTDPSAAASRPTHQLTHSNLAAAAACFAGRGLVLCHV